MVGSDYVARTRISDARDRTLADIGERCERVAAVDLEWLVAQGHIVLAPETAGLDPAPADGEEV